MNVSIEHPPAPLPTPLITTDGGSVYPYPARDISVL